MFRFIGDVFHGGIKMRVGHYNRDVTCIAAYCPVADPSVPSGLRTGRMPLGSSELALEFAFAEKSTLIVRGHSLELVHIWSSKTSIWNETRGCDGLWRLI